MCGKVSYIYDMYCLISLKFEGLIKKLPEIIEDYFGIKFDYETSETGGLQRQGNMRSDIWPTDNIQPEGRNG
jgi:hypothetical protein